MSGEKQSTPSTNSGAQADTEAEPQPQVTHEEFPTENPFEHWASPAELLQMRALWADVLQRHKNELETTTTRLHRMSQERDALVQEVKDTDNLRQLYASSTLHFNQIKAEREQWREEREMLILRLQKLTNDSAGTGVDKEITQELKGRLEETTSQLSVALEENRKLLELLNRKTLEVNESHHRRVVEDIARETIHSNNERKIVKLSHELELLKRSTTELKHQIQNLTHENSSLKASQASTRVDLLTADKNVQLSLETVRNECEEKLVAQQAERDDAEAALCDKIRSLEERLAHEMEESANGRAKLAEALAATISAKTKIEEASASQLEQLEAELSETQAIVRAKSQQHSDEMRQKSQEAHQMATQIQELQDDKTELQQEKMVLSSRLEEATAKIGMLRVELDRSAGECQRMGVRHQQVQQQLENLKNVETERDTFRVRAEQLEKDLHAQLGYYEKQIKESYTALQLLQASSRRENDHLRKKLHAFLKKPPSTDRKKQKTTESTDELKENVSPPMPPPETLNPQEILRANQETLDKLSRSLGN